MRRSPETLIKAALGDTLPAVLGLCALTFSHLASAGVTTLCDSRTIDPPDLEIDAAELTVELVDLGASAAVDIDITMEAETMMLPAPPDVDAMLRRMFDIVGDFEPARVPASSPAQTFPVADLSPPAVEADASMSGTDDSDNDANNDAGLPAVSTRIPGLSDDDLRRYRSRMYRTDI